MNTHLSFAYAGVEMPGVSAFADGENLADRCYAKLQELDEPSQFPPRLLVLLASPKYLEHDRAHDLVPGIVTFFSNRFEERVPLIGSSVAAVFFDQGIHEQGAVLICVASRLLEAKVEATTRLSGNPDEAVHEMLEALELAINTGRDPNPRANRQLLLFLPGQVGDVRPARLCHDLSKDIGYRLPITGGVSHPVTRDGDPGLQFTEFGVQQGAIVAARLEYQVPVASGLARSLHGTENYLKVTNPKEMQFSNDDEIGKQIRDKGFAVLGKKVEDRYRATVVVGADGRVRQFADLGKEENLELLATQPEKIVKAAEESVIEPGRRIQMENPAGCISFQCAACYAVREAIGINLQNVFQQMQNALGGAPVVGGFFDGEMGVDYTGQAMFANWAGATLTFGDEMRERAVWQHGFKAIVDSNDSLNKAQSVSQIVELSLDMVCMAGYPGALISLLLPDANEDWIIARGMRGRRFNAIKDELQSRLQDEQELAAIEKNEKLRYRRDCSSFTSATKPLWQIPNQYVVPLHGNAILYSSSSLADLNLIGVLHIDLGLSRKKLDLRDTEKHVLNSLAATVESSLVRMLNWEEIRIMRALDRAMNQALRANSVRAGRQIFLEAAVQAFGGISGYIRILHGHTLEMVADVGAYADAIREVRANIDSTDRSLCGEAFVRGDSRMVNNPPQDSVYSDFCERYRDLSKEDEKIKRLLSAVTNAGSFLVAVLKGALGRKVGTIIIIAEKPWHFHKYHIRCLEAAGDKLRSLSDHLEKTGPADFLLRIGANLPAAAYALDLGSALKPVVSNFRNLSKAQIVCLFLWDESFKKFILHAQSGWRQEGWELVAYYGKHDGWTGSVAMQDEPRYAQDLSEYKKKTGVTALAVYETAMFGSSRGYITESVGLPLKAGGKRLGVLTAFKCYSPAVPREPFSTMEQLDENMLAQAADRIAGYVSSLLLQKSDRLAKERTERLGKIYKAMLAAIDAGGPGPADVLCKTLPEAYKASKVLFYIPAGKGELKCVVHSHGEVPPDSRVLRVSQDLQMDATPKPVNEEERNNRELAAMHGAVLRACIPLSFDRNLLGVLDIHWPTNQTRAEQVFDSEELEFLRTTVQSVYHRHFLLKVLRETKKKMTEMEARAATIADAMVAPAKQALHRCNNIDALLEGLQSLVVSGTAQNEIVNRIREIRYRTRQLPLAMRFLKAGAEPVRAIEQLDNLVRETVSEFDWGQDIKCICAIPPGIEVNINRAWIIEAFYNILDNGIRAIQDRGGPGTLTISATTISNKVRISFRDTGIGMTKEEIEMMLKGSDKRTKLYRTGIGIPLTRVLLVEQDGNLTISSRKGFGTEVVVELPLVARRIDHATDANRTAAAGHRSTAVNPDFNR